MKLSRVILPSYSHVNTAVLFQYVNTNDMLGAKARWERHDDAACCFEEILKIKPNKTAVVRLLTFHLTVRWRHARYYMDFYTWTYQLLANTLCHPEDLAHMNGLRESKRINAADTSWWWWSSSSGGARGVVVIVVRNGHGDTSSNPGREWLNFT